MCWFTRYFEHCIGFPKVVGGFSRFFFLFPPATASTDPKHWAFAHALKVGQKHWVDSWPETNKCEVRWCLVTLSPGWWSSHVRLSEGVVSGNLFLSLSRASSIEQWTRSPSQQRALACRYLLLVLVALISSAYVDLLFSEVNLNVVSLFCQTER